MTPEKFVTREKVMQPRWNWEKLEKTFVMANGEERVFAIPDGETLITVAKWDSNLPPLSPRLLKKQELLDRLKYYTSVQIQAATTMPDEFSVLSNLRIKAAWEEVHDMLNANPWFMEYLREEAEKRADMLRQQTRLTEIIERMKHVND